MGRPGGGGGPRSGGGHRVGQSSGGGARTGRSSGGPSRAGHGGMGGGPRHHGGPRGFGGGPRHHGGPMHHRGPMHHHHHHRGPVHHHRPHRHYHGRRRSDPLTTILAALLILIAFLVVRCQDDRPAHARREKLRTSNAYMESCIVDGLEWFDDASKTGKKLKTFWKKTGVQPYIVIRNYDETLTTDEQKDEWAVDYYQENIDADNVFLYVYFAEKDVDGQVGYMSCATGAETSYVMDEEAIQIFWENIDEYWESNLSTDDMFVKVFEETAKDIMR